MAMQDYEAESDAPTVSDWLERVSLSEIETQGDGERERVSLMTVHSAKGLEFQTVFIAALEDLRSGPYNINPHYEQQARRLAIARGRHVAPSGRLEQVDYRKKLRLPAHSPEELFGSLEAGIRAVKPHEDKSNRDIARALGLDAYDPLTLATLENLRDGLYTSNPSRKGVAKRSGGRTAAQSNAAKAMKLFHSGQASSLAEAWAMLRRR
jgi:hypothetical protein